MNSFDYSLLEVYFYKKLYSQCNSTAEMMVFTLIDQNLQKDKSWWQMWEKFHKPN